MVNILPKEELVQKQLIRHEEFLLDCMESHYSYYAKQGNSNPPEFKKDIFAVTKIKWNFRLYLDSTFSISHICYALIYLEGIPYVQFSRKKESLNHFEYLIWDSCHEGLDSWCWDDNNIDSINTVKNDFFLKNHKLIKYLIDKMFDHYKKENPEWIRIAYKDSYSYFFEEEYNNIKTYIESYFDEKNH